MDNEGTYSEEYTQDNLSLNNSDIKKNPNTKFKIIFVLAFITLSISVSISVFWYTKNNTLIKSFSTTVYPNSFVLDIDVSGLTKEALHSKLESIVNQSGNTKIKINIGEKTFETTYKNIDVSIPYDEFENEILGYGKDKDFFTKLNLIKKPLKKDYEFKFSYNIEKFNEFLATISKDVNVSPINSSINISGGSINILDGTDGYSLNSDELISNLNLSIKDINPKDELVLNTSLIIVEETIKKESLQGVTDKVSTFTTSYKDGPSGYNLQIAANNIDNTLIMPGETFSCESAIGPTTPENGFVLANTYVSGKVVKNYGGGVCQLSSTLYNTILHAGIIPSERLNHMMPVSYIPMGLDSTLADGLIDLKFKNDFEYPIVINSAAINGNLTVEFWSNPSVLKGLTYDAKSIPTSNLSADTYLYSYDANGNMVSETFLNTSTYEPLP